MKLKKFLTVVSLISSSFLLTGLYLTVPSIAGIFLLLFGIPFCPGISLSCLVLAGLFALLAVSLLIVGASRDMPFVL